jgi:lysophospholipase L1-like esterase
MKIMIRPIPNLLLLFTALLLVSYTLMQKRKITVYLVGDSTISIKEIIAYPETGWGMPFAHFFDSSVIVDNRAKNGRSTKSFLVEKLWQPIVRGLNEGDYVFIQFGHNDEVKEKVGRYTPIDEFKSNLVRYITDSRSKKAIPVVLTPVARRKFDGKGTVVETHLLYSEAVREVAMQQKVTLIDLDKRSQELLQQFGHEFSKHLFLQLQPGEHPNYPDGRDDNTHFSELGARKIAQIVLAEIKTSNLDLANRIVKPVTK